MPEKFRKPNMEYLDEDEWRYLLAGPTGDIKIENNPTTWIS